MTYSNMVVVALLIHCILNHDVLLNHHHKLTMPAAKEYRWLMLSVTVFYVFDALWGVLYDAHAAGALFADTTLYFVAMSTTVFLWTRYVIEYLQETNWFIKALTYAGWAFLAFAAISLTLNLFTPVVFWFDEGGGYHIGGLRIVFLAMQIVLFASASCHMLYTSRNMEPRVKRRHLAIGSFGVAMTTMVMVQVAYPLLPLYAIGSVLGTCVLHTFVLEGLIENRRAELEEMLRREEDHKKELGSVQQMALRDSLTGVKNKHAYAQWEERFNEEIRNGEREPFAVVVCDVNNLKTVNDTYGHKAGDTCIKNACAKVCGTFSHSPVFRIGGDEFVALLCGSDYDQRAALMARINALPRDRSQIKLGETVAVGIAEYDKEQHTSLLDVFEDADKAMYERKQLMKASLENKDGSESESVSESAYIPVFQTRKHILIADDIESNREIIGDLLQDDYDISYASDGVEALQLLRGHKGDIDLVLLDLRMPNKDGREVVAEMQVDEDLASIPVVFLTVDQAAELDCLRIGAMDFIPKPYPSIEIVKARIDKCIELAENRELIHYAERDRLTGLLNREFFYRYVIRLDRLYEDTNLDALACDVNQFHLANRQFGRQFCDRVLRSIGACMRGVAQKTGGIACREGSDTFLLYCLHQEDYGQLLEESLAEAFAKGGIGDEVSVRFGVFACAQQEADVELRFARAKTAADGVRNDPQRACGFYEPS